jgi:hypothetical protein
MEASIPLSKKNEPLFRQTYNGLRKAILSRAFPAGSRLPSTRDLAKQLGEARSARWRLSRFGNAGADAAESVDSSGFDLSFPDRIP